MEKWLYILFIYFEVFTNLFACCCSVAHSRLTLQHASPPLQHPIDHSPPGLPVPHRFPKFAEVHAHCTCCGMCDIILERKLQIAKLLSRV